MWLDNGAATDGLRLLWLARLVQWYKGKYKLSYGTQASNTEKQCMRAESFVLIEPTTQNTRPSANHTPQASFQMSPARSNDNDAEALDNKTHQHAWLEQESGAHRTYSNMAEGSAGRRQNPFRQDSKLLRWYVCT